MDVKFLYADNEDSNQTADAQTDLSLRLAHVAEGTFSQVVACINKADVELHN